MSAWIVRRRRAAARIVAAGETGRRRRTTPRRSSRRRWCSHDEVAVSEARVWTLRPARRRATIASSAAPSSVAPAALTSLRRDAERETTGRRRTLARAISMARRAYAIWSVTGRGPSLLDRHPAVAGTAADLGEGALGPGQPAGGGRPARDLVLVDTQTATRAASLKRPLGVGLEGRSRGRSVGDLARNREPAETVYAGAESSVSSTARSRAAPGPLACRGRARPLGLGGLGADAHLGIIPLPAD